MGMSARDGERMRIQVFGPGCARCKQLEEVTREALGALGEPAEVEKVERLDAMTEAGVLRTPALAVNGKLVLQGRVPGVRELVTLLSKAR
jgi:small redox-active disulfide protein 2